MKKRDDGTRRRPTRIAMLAVRVCLSGCVMPVAVHSGSGPAPTFEPARHEVVLGIAERLTVLTGFLTGGAVADLAAVHVDGDGDRRLRVFRFADGGWAPAVEATLRREAAFVNVARIDGRERLIVYGGGRLTWFDPESATERDLAAAASDFRQSERREVLHVDMTRDLNGNGRDDLALVDGHGFRVLIQMPGGRFADPVRAGPTTGLDRVYGADGYRYRPWEEGGRVHEMDYDLDGRSDLVYWNPGVEPQPDLDGGRSGSRDGTLAGSRDGEPAAGRDGFFAVHLQDDRGLFPAQASATFTTAVPFDSDQIASLAAPTGIRNRRRDHMPEGESAGRVLDSLTDMNGDGIADLVVFSLQGGSLWRMHSSYEVHFGSQAPGGGTEFSPEAGAVVRSEGILAGIDRHDIDGDGQVDVMLTSFHPTVWSAIRVLVMSVLTGAGSFDLQFFRMEDGLYAERPNAVREIRPRAPRKTGERNFWPAVRLGDMNGDGRSDLLVVRNRKRLHVHLGVPGPDLFARRPVRIAVAAPEDEEYTWLADLNGDGRQDVVLHHAPVASEPHRVTVLMSR